jgi:hypothetical protein
MAKELPEHKDKLGRALKLGDCVAYSSHNSLGIGTVVKFNPKMVKIQGITPWRSDANKYPHDMVLLTGPEVTMFLLTNTK